MMEKYYQLTGWELSGVIAWCILIGMLILVYTSTVMMLAKI